MEAMICPSCFGKGLKPRCLACGKISYEQVIEPDEKQAMPYIIPPWYRKNFWDAQKIVYNDHPGRTLTLQKLDYLVKEGELPDFSVMFLLPPDSGKRIAMYTLIQKYLNRKLTVAPIFDISSLHILLNRNRYEDQQMLLELFSSDIVIIYSTKFVTRKNGARIFETVTQTRALKGRPTIFFGDCTFQELSEWGTNLDYKKNQVDNDKLAHPFIFDGVAERIIDGQAKSNETLGTGNE